MATAAEPADLSASILKQPNRPLVAGDLIYVLARKEKGSPEEWGLVQLTSQVLVRFLDEGEFYNFRASKGNTVHRKRGCMPLNPGGPWCHLESKELLSSSLIEAIKKQDSYYNDEEQSARYKFFQPGTVGGVTMTNEVLIDGDKPSSNVPDNQNPSVPLPPDEAFGQSIFLDNQQHELEDFSNDMNQPQGPRLPITNDIQTPAAAAGSDATKTLNAGENDNILETDNRNAWTPGLFSQEQNDSHRFI